jgi:type I restriction enzyme S subunit
VSTEWRQSTWGDEISLEYGKAIRGYQDSVAPFRVFGSNGPIGWTENALAQGPGVILGRKGAYRGVHFSRDPFFVIDTAYYVKPKSDLDMRWLYYAIIHHKLGEIDDGSPIPSTTRAAVYVRDVEVPPLPEQRAIAATLGALDDKIELNRKMNATLEAMARALFRDWFVDFGPTRARMAGSAPYLSPDLWALFPDRLDDEGKPEGWEEKGLLDLATLISGGTPKTDKAEYWNGDIPWASAKDVSQCKDAFLIETERSISESGLKNSATKIIPKYATAVVARGATTGRSCMFGSDIAMNQTCYALTSRSDHPFWLNCAFRELVDRLVNAAHGSVFDTITTRTIEAVSLVQDSMELRNPFEHMVTPLFQRLLANVIESRTLAQTRDLLLPRLMSGDLRVADLAASERETAA